MRDGKVVKAIMAKAKEKKIYTKRETTFVLPFFISFFLAQEKNFSVID